MAAPFTSSQWDSLPREPALHTVQDLPLAQSAAALALLLDDAKDEQILKEACLGLCQLFGEGIQNDRIQAILEADVVPRLVSLLKPSKSRTVPVSVQSAALQVIGNVACGDDRQTQVIIDCDALPCLKALLSSNDRGIRKEVCWISSNITESSHQVQAVLDAGILPPLLKLLESQDSACREDATWVLYNISSNHDMRQINYLAEQNGIRALCNLLNCSKELDVVWKSCGTVAAVALKGLRNILVAGQQEAASDPNGYNRMAALVADAHGVERIEALTNHQTLDVRQRARLLLERFFGAEQSPTQQVDFSPPADDFTNAANAAIAAAAAAIGSPGTPLPHGLAFSESDVSHSYPGTISEPAFIPMGNPHMAAGTCSCPHPHTTVSSDSSSHILNSLFSPRSATDNSAAVAEAHYRNNMVLAAANTRGYQAHAFSTGVVDPFVTTATNGFIPANLHDRPLTSLHDTSSHSPVGSSTGSTSESDPEDDDSDLDLLPRPPAACNCLLCTDATPLVDRKPRKATTDSSGGQTPSGVGHGIVETGATVDKVVSSRYSSSLSAAVGAIDPQDVSSGCSVARKLNHMQASSRRADDLSCTSISCSPAQSLTDIPSRSLCDFCSGGGRLGDGKAGLAAKLGRAVRLGHSHCAAILLSRMTWSQRVAATEAPALLHPGGGPPDGSVSSSLPAVVLAAHLGKPDCLALLLRRCRPDLDVTHGKKRLTPLAWAAHKGYMKCCALLLEHGASPSAKCGECLTALHLAASGGGHLAICKLLLEHGAPVNARSTKKQTPLCLATQKGNFRLGRLLLDYGADCNNEDEGKFTPLHIAASNGSTECAEELVKAGARIDCKTRNGVTPLHYAVQGGHAGVVKLLVSAGAKVNCTRKPLLIIAADDGNREVVQILLDALAAIDCRANIKVNLDKETEIQDKLTPLHLAASKGHKDVVELLLRRGSFVDAATDKGKWTALDFAVLNAHAGCAIVLLEHGATVTDNAKNAGQSGCTLVQHAARNGNKDVVRMLIHRLQEQKLNASAPLDSVGVNPGPHANIAVPSVVERAGTDLPQIASDSRALTLDPSPPSPLSLSATTVSSYGSNPVAGASTPMLVNGPLSLPNVNPAGMFTDMAASALAVPQSLPSLSSSNTEFSMETVNCKIDLHDSRHCDQGRVDRSSSIADRCHSCPPAPTPHNGYTQLVSEAEQSAFSAMTLGEEQALHMNGCHHYPRRHNLDAAPPKQPSNANARRRTTKEDRTAINRQRERELKRREAEANEARERLEEAVSQRSVAKLTEAIAHVSKLVLHLATSVGSDGGNTAPAPSNSLTGDVLEDGYNAPTGSTVDSSDLPAEGTPQSMDCARYAALSMEVGLGNEVHKARKILASLQAEERRAKEERAREAAELKRDNSQQLVQKAVTAVLEGGDTRSLNRTVNRALRIILDESDPCIREARRVVNLVGDVERASSQLFAAIDSRDLLGLEAAIKWTTQALQALNDVNGAAAATRAFSGRDPADVISRAESVQLALVKERDSAEAKFAAAKANETETLASLEAAIKSGKLQRIEEALEAATLALLSKESEAAAKVDAAKKVYSKALKTERRKLRQANGTKDLSKIDAAITAARSLEVFGLKADIDSSVELSELLREQDAKRAELNDAIEIGDMRAIADIRTRLEALGMFPEAEAARVELDNLQRASRARSLLSGAYKEAKYAIESFDETLQAGDGGVWSWPEAHRLNDISKKSRGKFGGSLDDLCSLADSIVEKLAKVGRQVLSNAAKSGDTRKLAAAIAGYEKSFVSVDNAAVFDLEAGNQALVEARDRLAELQSKEQEKIKAESALVKTEYALANSRRSAAKSRGARRLRGVHGPTNTSSSVASTNSSECGEEDTLDAEMTLSPSSIETNSRNLGPAVDGASAVAAPAETECSHFYLWKEGTIVQCTRCSNIRESVNGDWLQRVKRRTPKLQDGLPMVGASVVNQVSGIGTREPNSDGHVAGTMGHAGAGKGKPVSFSSTSQFAALPDKLSYYRGGAVGRSIAGHAPAVSVSSAQTNVALAGSYLPTPVYQTDQSHRRGIHSGAREMSRPPLASQAVMPRSIPPNQYAVSVQDLGFQHSGDTLDNPIDRMTRTVQGNSSLRVDSLVAHSGMANGTPSIPVSSVAQNLPVMYGAMVGGLRVSLASGQASPSRSGIGSVSSENGTHCASPIEAFPPEDVAGVNSDLSMEFANENFGFDIDSLIINENER